MSKSKKIWIGILTILPGAFFALYLFFFMLMFFGIFSEAIQHQGDPEPPMAMLTYMPIMIGILFLGIALTTVMTVYHIVHINNSKTMSSNDKLIWVLVVILLNWFGDVAYWYMKIWKEEKPHPTSPATVV